MTALDQVRDALRKVMDEIGVPGSGYPQSITNAYAGVQKASYMLDRFEAEHVVLTQEEGAQIREVLGRMLILARALGIAHTDAKVVDLEGALALLDGKLQRQA